MVALGAREVEQCASGALAGLLLAAVLVGFPIEALLAGGGGLFGCSGAWWNLGA